MIIVKPHTREVIGHIGFQLWQDNAILRQRLAEDPEVFWDFVRDALQFAANEGFDRIVTPEFRKKWTGKLPPAKSK